MNSNAMITTTPFSCLAPAKINLFLHIVGRRADGYHLLQSVFRLLDYGDTLHFSLRKDGKILHTHPLPNVPIEQDLCVRAARLLQQTTGCSLGVSITLEKILPMGGGLGGGSSDAATVLLALNHIWQTGLSRQDLCVLGAQLGADVPFFIFGQDAFVEGIGEQLTAFPQAPATYIVLTPPVQVNTAAVFAEEGLTRDTKPITMLSYEFNAVQNNLQAVVCHKNIIVQEYLNALFNLNLAGRMTGSGACVFAECTDKHQANSCLSMLQKKGFSGFVAQSLEKHPLYSLL